MKKPMKFIIKAFLVIIVLVVLAILALPLYISPVATTVAGKVVPMITGTDFKMDAFSLNPYTGKIRIRGVNLANPQGFDEPTALSVRTVCVDLDTSSLFTKKIHVIDVTIDEPFVSYVFDAAESNNFDRIIANATEKLGLDKKKEKKEKSDIKFVIDRIAINGTWVKYRKLKMPVPVPTLTNIGGGSDPDGASSDEVVGAVWQSVSDKFSAVGVVGDGAKATFNALGDGTKAVGSGATATVNAVGDGAKATVNAVGDGAKAVGDTAKDALKKMGSLFGK